MFQVVVRSLENDDNHLFWQNYHTLTEERIKSFMKLKPCGLYLMICKNKWIVPKQDDEREMRLQKAASNDNFNFLLKDHIDRIVRLLLDNQPHFRVTDLKNICFTVEIFHNHPDVDEVAEHLQSRLCRRYEAFSAQKHLEWKFVLVDQKKDTPKTKFRIEIHLTERSFVMGINLLTWDDMYPYFLYKKRFGSPVFDIIKLLDIRDGMIVMDLDAGFGENVLEISRHRKCHTIGLMETRKQAAIKDSWKHFEKESDIVAQYHEFIVCDNFLTVPSWFNVKILNRVFLWTNLRYPADRSDRFLRRVEAFLLACAPNCMALIALPFNEYLNDAMKTIFYNNLHFRVYFGLEHIEIRERRGIYKIVRTSFPCT